MSKPKWEDLVIYCNGQLQWKHLPELSPRHRGKKAGHMIRSIGYFGIAYRRKIYLVHRVIWELFNGPIPSGRKIDHINRIRTDNRIENLRLVDNYANSQNQSKRKGTSSKHKGVYFYKRVGKYLARLHHRDKIYYLGYFENEDDAGLAYNEKAREVFGEYASLNVIPGDANG